MLSLVLGSLGCRSRLSELPPAAGRTLRVEEGRGWPFTNHCLRDAAGSVRRLDPDPPANIAYRSGNSKYSYPAPTLHNDRLGHRQGISRLVIEEGRDAGNYFIVTASTHGSLPGFEVVRIGRGVTPGPLGRQSDHLGRAPTHNRIVNWVAHDNQSSHTNYNHAGGVQVIGRIAVVAFEAYRVDDPSDAGFRMWNLEPRFPQASELVQRENESTHGSVKHAGSVGITQLDDGRYLVMVFGRHAREVEVFTTEEPFLSFDADDWRSLGAWDVSVKEGTLPEGARWYGYQNTQLLSQCDGGLFMLGSVNANGNDWVHLYQVTLDPLSSQPTFTRVAERHLFCDSERTRGREFCTLKAGGGPYVDPAGRLSFYAVERHSCVAGGCIGRGRRDGKHVGVREFAEVGSPP